MPHFETADNPEVRERFMRAARAAARMDHPNLCRIYEAGMIDGIWFLTMRHLPGNPLSAYTGRPHPPHDAVKIVAKLTQVLEYAHGKGLIHRDLKPSNVMMCPGTGPTVMDFGLAKQMQQLDQKLLSSEACSRTARQSPAGYTTRHGLHPRRTGSRSVPVIACPVFPDSAARLPGVAGAPVDPRSRRGFPAVPLPGRSRGCRDRPAPAAAGVLPHQCRGSEQYRIP